MSANETNPEAQAGDPAEGAVAPATTGENTTSPGVPQQGEMPFAVVMGQAVTALPKDLYIPPDALEVILEAFEGPLDLLLYLIRRQNLDGHGALKQGVLSKEHAAHSAGSEVTRPRSLASQARAARHSRLTVAVRSRSMTIRKPMSKVFMRLGT